MGHEKESVYLWNQSLEKVIKFKKSNKIYDMTTAKRSLETGASFMCGNLQVKATSLTACMSVMT